MNDTGEYAIIYEQSGLGQSLDYYSKKAELKFSKELATLLHGSKVMNGATAQFDGILDENATAIINLAKSLTDKNITWHHHVLYPGCKFNINTPNFTLMLENPANNQTLTAPSTTEPKKALSHIEKLFYAKT
jgi:hypothetical protein